MAVPQSLNPDECTNSEESNTSDELLVQTPAALAVITMEFVDGMVLSDSIRLCAICWQMGFATWCPDSARGWTLT
jgi:hypothetical protein